VKNGSPGGQGIGLKLARQARGFSQQQLAGMAGVSRQAVSLLESGLSDPSLRVALALARTLGTTVEDLFGPIGPAPQVTASPLAPLDRAGGRVTLVPVGEVFVALPLSGSTATRAGFLPASGLVIPGAAAPGVGDVPAPAGPVQPIGPPRPTLVVAGGDPALPLLETPLALVDPPVELAWWPCTSGEAVRLAAAGLAHVASVQRQDSHRDDAVRELLRTGAEIIRFCSWRAGLVLRPGLDRGVAGVRDLPGSGLRLVNQGPGSDARRVLDRALAEHGIDPGLLRGYETTAAGHLEVAAAIAAGLADVGVTSEPASLAYGLAFVPLARENVDLVVPAAHAGSHEVRAMIRALSSRWLLDQLTSLPGYDASRCGERLPATGPAAGRLAVRRVDAALGVGEGVAGAAPAELDQLGRDRDRGLLRRAGSQVEADRGAEPG
jgi:putative molybdopterin biosynthesis protein